MPKRADTPCARCGQLMWTGSTSLPPGEAMHRSCRTLSIAEGPHSNRYAKGCRCDTCRTANNARMLARYHRKMADRSLSCEVCGESFTSQHRRARRCTSCAYWQKCETCGKRVKNRDKCMACTPRPVVQLELKFPAQQQLGPLRQAIHDQDDAAVIAVIKADTVQTDAGCWEWQRVVKGGYPLVRIKSRDVAVHRLVAEAVHGPLGSQPVHHRCANTVCVAPDHLQPVTHRENVAEMMARRYYVQRISELEAALADVAPDHPALQPLRIGAA